MELGEHVGEVALDGPGGDEQVLGDLAVGEPLGGQLGDAALAGGQGLEAGEQHPARPGTGGAQLGLGPVGERAGAGVVRGVDGATQDVAGVDPAVAATQERAEIGEGASLFELGVGAAQHLDRLAQQHLAGRTAGDQPGGPQRHAEGAGGAEGAGQRQFFRAQESCRVMFAQRQMCERGLGAPGEIARAARLRPPGDLAGQPEVGECLGEPPLRQPEAAASMAQQRRRLRHGPEIGRQRLKSPFGVVELAALDERLDQRPHGDRTMDQGGRRVVGPEQGPRIRLHRGEIAPPENAGRLTPLLTRMLAADSADRPSMAEVARELAALTAGDAPAPTLPAAASAAVPVAATVPAAPTVPEVAEVSAGGRRGLVVVGAGAALLCIAVVVAILLVVRQRPPQDEAAQNNPGPLAAAPATSSQPSPSPAPATLAPSSAPPTTTKPTVSTVASAKTAGAALTEYYNNLLSNLDTSFARLTSNFKVTRGQTPQTYASFWGQYRSVSAQVVSENGNTVTAKITYVATGGKTSTEQSTYTLIQEGGTWLVDTQRRG